MDLPEPDGPDITIGRCVEGTVLLGWVDLMCLWVGLITCGRHFGVAVAERLKQGNRKRDQGQRSRI